MFTKVRTLLLAAGLLGTLGAAWGLPTSARASAVDGPVPAIQRHSMSIDVDGCNILILWSSYRGNIEYDRSGVRVRGSISWAKLWEGARLFQRGPIPYPASQPSGLRTNGRVWNWPEELQRERCNLNRRYRFRLVAPAQTHEPVRSNDPYSGTERWLYFPSSNSWTTRTTIDLGWIDLCIMDGTKCNGPYYPTAGWSTPILSGDE